MSFIASMVSTAVVSAGGSALLGGTLGVLATGAAGAGLGAGGCCGAKIVGCTGATSSIW